MRSKDNKHTMQNQNHDHQALYPIHIPVRKNHNHEVTKEARYERHDTNHESRDHNIYRSNQKCDTRDEGHNHHTQDQIHDNQALHPNHNPDHKGHNHERRRKPTTSTAAPTPGAPRATTTSTPTRCAANTRRAWSGTFTTASPTTSVWTTAAAAGHHHDGPRTTHTRLK